MSLFNEASLYISPNGVKAGKLYAVKPTDGSGDLSVVRATDASYTGSNGVIQYALPNVPRLDYSNGTCPSILVEPQRTNILLNSETLATQSVTVTAQPYTLSFYGGGTVVLSGTHSATVVGLGTARKTYTFTPTAGTLTLTVTGTCTKAQFEAGSYATSHIPSTTNAVTRNADVISKTGISDLIGQTKGTILCDINLTKLSETKTLFAIDNGTTNEYIALLRVSSNIFRLTIKNSSGSAVNIINSIVINDARCRIGIAYKNGDYAMYVNGILRGTSTNTTNYPTTTLTQFVLSNANYGQLNDSYNVSALWKTRLSNSELATLTTI